MNKETIPNKTSEMGYLLKELDRMLYGPKNIAIRIESLLPIVRMKGTFVLDNIAETEGNTVLREGFNAITRGDFSNLDKEERKQAIIGFIKARCKKYEVDDIKSQATMAIGLYALLGGYNPAPMEKIFEILNSSTQAKASNLLDKL